MAGTSKAYVLGPGEGRSIDLGSFAMTVKANSDETNGVFSLLEAEEPPGFGPPVHVHHEAAEAFYVLEGEYVMFLDDREVACRRFIRLHRGRYAPWFQGRGGAQSEAQLLLSGGDDRLLRRSQRRDPSR